MLLTRILLLNGEFRRARYEISDYVIRALLNARVSFPRVRNECYGTSASEGGRWPHRRRRCA